MRNTDKMERWLREIVGRCTSPTAVDLAVYAMTARTEETHTAYDKAVMSALKDKTAVWTPEERKDMLALVGHTSVGLRGGMTSTIGAVRCTQDERMRLISAADEMGQPMTRYMRASLFTFEVPPAARREVEQAALDHNEDVAEIWGRVLATALRYAPI